MKTIYTILGSLASAIAVIFYVFKKGSKSGSIESELKSEKDKNSILQQESDNAQKINKIRNDNANLDYYNLADSLRDKNS